MCPLSSWADLPAKNYTKVLRLMGSRFEITAVSSDSVKAWQAIHAAIDEVQTLEKTISSWDSSSQTSTINRQAGIAPVAVGEDLFNLITRSLKISALTQGAFDITFASMDKIWRFDGSMTTPPSDAAIAQAKAHIGYQKIQYNTPDQTIFLPEKGMKIGFGAIGKGMAANRAKAILKEHGIASGLINAGGDLIAWGKQADGSSWRIAIADPKNKEQLFSWLHIENMAVVTSGNYEKFIELDGVRYAHIIDPRTGWPVRGLQSVTIICPDAEMADALATAVFVMGASAGLHLINQLNQVECVLVNDQQEIITSDHIELNPYHHQASHTAK